MGLGGGGAYLARDMAVFVFIFIFVLTRERSGHRGMSYLQKDLNPQERLFD